MRILTQNKMHLAGDVLGPPDGPAVLLLHGGGQTRRSWGSTAQQLADHGYRTLNVDLRGHGETGWDPTEDYSPSAFADDVRAVVRAIGRPTALVGASMGGLASVLAAGEVPRVDCSALVLVDVTPTTDASGRDRIQDFMRSGLDGYESVEEAADAVSRYLPHRPRPTDLSGLEHNLWRADDGRLRWHWDPALLDEGRSREHDQIAERFERAIEAVQAPIILVRGGNSELVKQEHARAFRQLVPTAEYAEVGHAAHMVAGDRNERFTDVVVDFLERRLPVDSQTEAGPNVT